MTCWPVSARVGNVKNNDPSLIEPLKVRLAALALITRPKAATWLLAGELRHPTYTLGDLRLCHHRPGSARFDVRVPGFKAGWTVFISQRVNGGQTRARHGRFRSRPAHQHRE